MGEDKQEAAQLVSNGAPAEAPAPDVSQAAAAEAGQAQTNLVPNRLPSRKDSAFQVPYAFVVPFFLWPPKSSILA